jgi:invasion protein IalB
MGWAGTRPASAQHAEDSEADMMRGLIATVSGLLMVIGAWPALAQSATKIGQHSAWGTYSYQAASGKVCYVLTVPTDKQPPTLDHGDIFFFVSQRPGQEISFEPQFIASYNFQTDSKVTVTVGDKKFSMFTRGKSAWVENAAEEPILIAAMKSGTDMKIGAKSGRGNPTSYVFSLKGISAALDSIRSCK